MTEVIHWLLIYRDSQFIQQMIIPNILHNIRPSKNNQPTGGVKTAQLRGLWKRCSFRSKGVKYNVGNLLNKIQWGSSLTQNCFRETWYIRFYTRSLNIFFWFHVGYLEGVWVRKKHLVSTVADKLTWHGKDIGSTCTVNNASIAGDDNERQVPRARLSEMKLHMVPAKNCSCLETNRLKPIDPETS